MEGPVAPPVRRTLTPAVLAAALFVVACAAVAISFVASRGGLQMPIAAAGSGAAHPSGVPSAAPSTVASIAPSAAPSPEPPSPSPASSAGPTQVPTAAPSATPAGPPDPLTALPGCPELPGCYQYTIRRGDSLSGVASRYAIPERIVRALNPDVPDAGTIVVGEILYLGRDPKLRLEACPGTVSCWLYIVRPGDLLSTIAGRYGVTVEAILAANPAITDVNTIFSGQVLRLVAPEG